MLESLTGAFLLELLQANADVLAVSNRSSSGGRGRRASGVCRSTKS